MDEWTLDGGRSKGTGILRLGTSSESLSDDDDEEEIVMTSACSITDQTDILFPLRFPALGVGGRTPAPPSPSSLSECMEMKAPSTSAGVEVVKEGKAPGIQSFSS